MSAVPKPIETGLPSSEELFPSATRVVYKRAPIRSVVTQLRFPRILRIESGPPADFQDRVRGIFPLLEQGPAPVQLPPGVQAQQIPIEMMQLLSGAAGAIAYRFLTEDRRTSVVLTPESISLNTTAYTQWSDFKKLFEAPLDALTERYQPAFFTRVGLRYQNMIVREELELGDVPWSQLLEPKILGEIAQPEFERALESTRRVLRLKASDMNILIQHGTMPQQTTMGNSKGYGIDCDFSSVSQKTVTTNVREQLDRFNDRAFRAFRWCITKPLHHALGPEPD
jgi:uncharacterized protein (TIGR04255 family)